MGRGWTSEEIAVRLAKLPALKRNFALVPEGMTPERGWNQVVSQSQLASEKPGAVEDPGPFLDTSRALQHFVYSDPRIVQVHSDEDSPLSGRRVLLELKSLGLHMLVPILIAELRNDTNAEESVFGMCFDTLDGHIEAGREWFLLRKDLATGELRFRIQASWRLGQFPNPWMKVGFMMVGKRYQRAWHHLAHARLREHIHKDFAGVVSAKTPVQFWATRALVQAATGLEKERELDAH